MWRTVQSGRVWEEKGVEQTAQVKVAVHYELQLMEFVEATVLSNIMPPVTLPMHAFQKNILPELWSSPSTGRGIPLTLTTPILSTFLLY